MNNNPSPENPGTSPVKEPGRQQPPRPGDPVAPPDQPDIAPPSEPIRQPPQYTGGDRNAVRSTALFIDRDAVASKGLRSCFGGKIGC
jgi:hypothetical protein